MVSGQVELIHGWALSSVFSAACLLHSQIFTNNTEVKLVKKGGNIIRSRGTSGKGDCGEKQLKAETKNY